MLTKQDEVNEELCTKMLTQLDRFCELMTGGTATHAFANGYKTTLIKRMITLAPASRQSWLEGEISHINGKIRKLESL
jgi:hypothetical protein